MSRVLCALMMLSVAAAVHADAPVILVFGDSLSAGYGLPQGKSWVDLLRQRVQTHRPAYQVVNASLSGETTVGGRSRLQRLLTTHRPQIVILELGGNDALRGQPLQSTRDNLLHMVRLAQESGAQVLLVGMRLPPNYGPDYTKKFQDVYTHVARQTRAAYVPFLLEGFAEQREMFQPDGVHPTAQAQPQMLDNVWAKLGRMVGAKGAS